MRFRAGAPSRAESDTSGYRVGAKALGPEKTISGKMQETLASATQQARAVDEQRGISKTATDVRTLSPSLLLI